MSVFGSNAAAGALLVLERRGRLRTRGARRVAAAAERGAGGARAAQPVDRRARQFDLETKLREGSTAASIPMLNACGINSTAERVRGAADSGSRRRDATECPLELDMPRGEDAGTIELLSAQRRSIMRLHGPTLQMHLLLRLLKALVEEAMSPFWTFRRAKQPWTFLELALLEAAGLTQPSELSDR